MIKGFVSLGVNLPEGNNMEEEPQRVLAYALAKPIKLDTLDQISGGGPGVSVQWSSRETVVASGLSRQNVDVVIDASVDW